MGKHRGQPDRGDSFDAQFNASKARADRKREQGLGAYSADRYVQNAGQTRPSGQSNNESCGKATVLLLSLLGGVAWGLAEAAGRVL